MTLYKYTTYDTALKILLENSFRYTQPICFNDPFELYPTLEGSFTDDQFDEMIEAITQPEILNSVYETTIKNEYDKLNEFQKSFIPYEQYFIIMKNGIQKEFEKRNLGIKQLVLNNIKNGETDFNGMLDREYLKLINSTIGIFCLSKTCDNPLMWSHYCNSHSGVVLKIKAEKPFFEYLEEVLYPENKDRPKIQLSRRDYTPEESIDNYKKIFFSKSSEWAYEKEYRDYKALVNGLNTNLTDEIGIPIILFEFPKEIIEGVIFGVRVEDTRIVEFIDAVEKKYDGILFEKAYLNQDKYALDIYEIKKAV